MLRTQGEYLVLLGGLAGKILLVGLLKQGGRYRAHQLLRNEA